MSFVATRGGGYWLGACLLVASLFGAWSTSGGVGKGAAEATSAASAASADGVTVSLPRKSPPSTAIHVTAVAGDQLSMPIPSPFKLVTAFRLEMGPGELEEPIQISLSKWPVSEARQEVRFLRETSLPNKDGVEVPLWMEEAEGVIGHNNLIRTNSDQSGGLRFSSVYTVVVADSSQVAPVHGQVSFFFPVDRSGTFAVVAQAEQQPPVGRWLDPRGHFDLLLGLGPTTFTAIQVTPHGHVAETSVKTTVSQAEKGLQRPLFDHGLAIQLIPVADGLKDKDAPWAAPEITKGRLEKVGAGHQLTFEGKRFVFANERAPRHKRMGADPSEVQVNFHMPGRATPLVVSPQAGSTGTRFVVPVPAGVILGLSKVSITRPLWLRTRSGWDRRSEVTSEPEPLEGDPHHYFVPNGDAHLAVFDTSTHELVTRIPLGDPAVPSYPRAAVVPSRDNRAYVSLQQGGGVAVIDTELLQAVDLVPETPAMNVLPFEGGQPAGMVWCCVGRTQERLYVSDGQNGRIAIYDVTADNPTFHQRLAWMTIDRAPQGLGEMTVNAMRNRLYAIAPGSVATNGGAARHAIVVMDVGSESKTYTKEISRLPVDGTPIALDALDDTSGLIVFLTQKDDGSYLGLIRDDVMSPPAAISYIKVGPILSGDARTVLRGTGLKLIRAKRMSQWQMVPYAVVSYASGSDEHPGAKINSSKAGEVKGGVGIIENPTGPQPEFTEVMSVTAGSLPYLSSDQYGEMYVLDRRQETIIELDLTQVFAALADNSVVKLPLSLLQRAPKIVTRQFKSHGIPHDIAHTGALKVQLWVQ